MRKMILLAVVAAVSLAVFALPAVTNRILSAAPVTILADGTNLFPMCGGIPCGNRIWRSITPVLADGGGQYPLCGNKPCKGEVSQNSALLPAGGWRSRRAIFG
jgi:hypothetical protein